METPAGCLPEPVPKATAVQLLSLLCVFFCFFYDCSCILAIQQLLSPLSAVGSWIQVNLGQTRKVTGIVVQGCPQGDNWVTKFRIQHSTDGFTWTDYTADGAVSERAPRFILRETGEQMTILDFSAFPVSAGLDGQKHSRHPAARHARVGAVPPHHRGGGQRSGRPPLRGAGLHTRL